MNRWDRESVCSSADEATSFHSWRIYRAQAPACPGIQGLGKFNKLISGMADNNSATFKALRNFEVNDALIEVNDERS